MSQDALPWQDKQLLAGTPVYGYTMAERLLGHNKLYVKIFSKSVSVAISVNALYAENTLSHCRYGAD